MEIKGNIEFAVTAEENQYSYSFNRTQESELGALIVALDVLKYNKESLIKMLKEVKGKDKTMLKDRVNRVSVTENTIQQIVEFRIGLEFQRRALESASEQEPKTELTPQENEKAEETEKAD